MNWEKVLKKYPAFLTSNDLVELGVYPNLHAVYFGRKRQNSPKFVKLKHKILYPKEEVVAFLQKGFKDPNEHRDSD